MKRLPLNRELIEDRLRFIEQSVESLERYQSVDLAEYMKNPDNFRIAYYDLYTALEAVLDIGAHILSRIPGQKPQSYKDIPQLLAANKLLPRNFAEKKLVEMAGYRNRMTHFYHRIDAKEIHHLIKLCLSDFLKFSRYIGKIIKDPPKFGFPV
jgi:uncharacterized protein YutE (UPF0331/DUF86 family)